MYERRNRRAPDAPVKLSIAHNVRRIGRDGKSVVAPLIIAHLGDEDSIDPEAMDLLIGALTRIRDRRRAALAEDGKPPETPAQEAQALRDAVKPVLPKIRLLCSKAYGTRMLLDIAWRELGLREVILDALPAGVRDKDKFERILFGLVLARLEAPGSKLAAVQWLQEKTWMPEAEKWDEDDTYHGLDHLRRAWPKIEKHLCTETLRSRRLEKIIELLLDTTSIFTEADIDDDARAEIAREWRTYKEEGGEPPADPEPQVVNQPPLRMHGHSKDGHPHDPQIIMGLAVAATGEVLTHEVLPGNTSDKEATQVLMERARALLPEVALCAVMDSGMAGVPNLQWLHAAGVGWLAGMPLRQNKLLDEVLAGPLSWTAVERTTHRNVKPKVAQWSVTQVSVPPIYRAVAEQAENLVLVRSPERERRDLRKLADHEEEINVALRKSDRLEQGEVLHPTLRDKKLKRLVQLTDDKSRVELRKDAEQLEAQVLDWQVAAVQRQLAHDDAAEKDGRPHAVLQHAVQRNLVRVEDGRVVLDGTRVEAIRSRTAAEGNVARARQLLAENDARVVAYGRHPLLTDPKLRRYVRVSEDGKRVERDEAAIAQERQLAGLRAMRTTMVNRSATEVLTSYDRLLHVEATYRSFKDVLHIRPMYHRAEPRIRAHAMLCVLAERCMSWLEEQTGRTWAQLRKIFGPIAASEVQQGSMRWYQRTELSVEQEGVLEKLGYQAGVSRWASTAALPVTALPKSDDAV